MLRTTVVHRSREVRQSANAVPHLSENASTVLARVHNTAVYEPGPATRSAYAEQVLKPCCDDFERRLLYGTLCCAGRWARFFRIEYSWASPKGEPCALVRLFLRRGPTLNHGTEDPQAVLWKTKHDYPQTRMMNLWILPWSWTPQVLESCRYYAPPSPPGSGSSVLSSAWTRPGWWQSLVRKFVNRRLVLLRK